MTHVLEVKIYFEDTDCEGVVYYANYLKYFERARTEYFDSMGLSVKALMDEGIYFVVTEASVRYLAPGRYGDVLSVETTVEKVGPASITFGHRVLAGDKGRRIALGTVRLACVDRELKPVRLPEGVTMAAAGNLSV